MAQEPANQNPVAPAASRGESQTEFVEISFDEDASRVDWSETWKAVRFYALPLISFLVFVGIIVGTIIPNVTGIFTKIDEINVLREDDEKLDQRIQKLIALRAEQVTRQAIIEKINQIVPTGQSQVVAFRQRVLDNATARGINLDSSIIGEDIIDQTTEVAPDSEELEASGGLILIEIPSEFGLSSQFQGFRDLLNALYDGEDFFVVNEMNLSRTTREDGTEAWNAELNLVKYQFFVDNDFDPNQVYGSISENVIPDQLVIDFLEKRFLEGGFGTPTTTPVVTVTITDAPQSFPLNQ